MPELHPHSPELSADVMPITEEWRRLLEAALAFRDAAPWTWMTEENMFGIQDPESGVVSYACVMGELGEHLALALYEGAAGLAGFWQMRLSPPSDALDALLLQKCVTVSFEDRAELEKPDLDILKQIGVKVRGRQAWPLFRSYLPGYAPWHVTGAQARFLTLALEHALGIARRFQSDPSLLPQATPQGTYLVLARQPGNGEFWTETLQVPEPLEPGVATPPVPVDISRLQHLKTTLPATNGVVEMDFFLSPSGVREGDERPFFPFIILAADQASGRLLTSQISHPREIAQEFSDQFLHVVEGLQMLPARVQVSRADAQAFLEPFAKPLGVKVKLVQRLKALEDARAGLSAFLGFGEMGLDLLALAGVDDMDEIIKEIEAPPPRKSRKASAKSSVYQLKITLRDSRPPIWRRLQVSGDIRLNALHDVFQAAIGWHDSHLHAFVIAGNHYSAPVSELGMENEGRHTLAELVPDEGSRFSYEYDFGDGWLHEILVEKILPPLPETPLPLCLKGKEACPPEDCGGIWGYQGMIEILQNPTHPEHEETQSWLGEAFDPAQFSVEDANQRLSALRSAQ